jgi:hypothetical protein
MAVAGNSYVVELKPSHLGWGTVRHTNTRRIIPGEAYIHIPANIARSFGLYNSNNHQTGLGYNVFNCVSTDGFFSGELKSAGNYRKGAVYAKQFQGKGDLKALGRWFTHINAQVGDHVEVTWTSPTDITIRHF